MILLCLFTSTSVTLDQIPNKKRRFNSSTGSHFLSLFMFFYLVYD